MRTTGKQADLQLVVDVNNDYATKEIQVALNRSLSQSFECLEECLE